MEDYQNTPITMQVSRGNLITTLQGKINDFFLFQFRKEILDKVHSTAIKFVIIDLSGIPVFDSSDFEFIVETLKMISILGAKVVLVGINPGIISSLVAMDVSSGSIEVALDLSGALEKIDHYHLRRG